MNHLAERKTINVSVITFSPIKHFNQLKIINTMKVTEVVMRCILERYSALENYLQLPSFIN